ncbi:ROK family transcriptional regulator [Microlunatus ginsengisoli]|uniref:ROK family transcriptional regulator n=1 Tax=Microlunatus ginsengisoli TaxID=363863 RepID=UPI0031D175A2
MTSPSLSPWDVRSDTERTVALEVLLHGPVSRSELARRLRLSPASLTRLVAPMVADGLLEETDGMGTSALGRPTRPVRIAAGAGHFIGVRLTPTEAHGVVTNMRADILGVAVARLDDTTPAGVVGTVGDVIDRLRTDQQVDPYRVGVSLGGLVDHHARVRSAHFYDWAEPVDLAADVRRATAIPTVIDNDVMALTRAQSWFGIGRGMDRFAVITLGVGVGLGIVMHGELIESPDAGLGLIQHFPLNDSGPVCPAGHHGCAQAMLTDDAIAAQTSVAIRRAVNRDEALDLAADGDPAARAVADQSGRALGRLVAAVANLTMCYRIIVTGEGGRLAAVAGDAMRAQIGIERDPDAGQLEIHNPALTVADWAQGPAVLAIQTLVRPSA